MNKLRATTISALTIAAGVAGSTLLGGVAGAETASRTVLRPSAGATAIRETAVHPEHLQEMRDPAALAGIIVVGGRQSAPSSTGAGVATSGAVTVPGLASIDLDWCGTPWPKRFPIPRPQLEQEVLVDVAPAF